MTVEDSTQTIENSCYCLFALTMIMLTGPTAVGYGLSAMNPITPVINQTYAEIYQFRYEVVMPQSSWTLLLSLTMSLVFIGGLVGSLLTKILLKYLARKQTLKAIFAINTVGIMIVAIGLRAAKSYEMVICGRFVVGISLGIGMAMFPLVINELCVPHRRLRYGAIYGAVLPLAEFLGTFIAWSEILGAYERFLGSILFGLIFPVIFAASVYWIPETPRQVMLRNGSERTFIALKKLRVGTQDRDDAIVSELQSLSGPTEKLSESAMPEEASLKEIFVTPHYRKHFTSVVILYSSLTACGFANVLSFSDKIFRDAGLRDEFVTPATMGMYIVGTIASVIAILIMRWFDSKTMLISSNIVVAVTHALMTVSQQTSEDIPGMAWLSLAAMWIFMIAFSVITSVIFAVMGVLCTDKTRPISFLCGSAGFWLFGWFAGFISPYLTEWIQGYSFLLWMAITIFVLIYTYFCIPQTKGKTEEEIQAFFKK